MEWFDIVNNRVYWYQLETNGAGEMQKCYESEGQSP